MKEIRGFLDDVVGHAHAKTHKATVKRKPSAEDAPPGKRPPSVVSRDGGSGGASRTSADDHFDGFSATKSSDFLIDLEGNSMDHADDVRPYLMFLGVCFSKRYLPPAYRDKGAEEQGDYYVQKGKALLLSCWKRGNGYFLAPRNDLLGIHQSSWRHGTMPWLYHVERICRGVEGVKTSRDVGFNSAPDRVGGTGEIRMGEVRLILTNLRMPLLPRRSLAIRPDSHPDQWDEMIIRSYDPNHHPAPHWRSTTYITSMEVLHRSSKLFNKWTSPYHARIMDKIEVYIGDVKLLRDQVNGLHHDYDIPGLGLRKLEKLPIDQDHNPTSTMVEALDKKPVRTADETKAELSSAGSIPHRRSSISALARQSNMPLARVLDFPATAMTETDPLKFRFFRKDQKSAIDVNKYPGYPFPGYIHFDGLSPRMSSHFFIDLHGDSTDSEPDVRPYLLVVGRYALEKELRGKLGKHPANEAELSDALVPLGKDYLLWRWRKGEGYFLRPRDGLLELNKLDCIRTMPWLHIVQQLAGKKASRLSSQLGDLVDVGFRSSSSNLASKTIQTKITPPAQLAPSASSSVQDLILTNLRVPLLPRKQLTIDPYINEPSWDQMVLTQYGPQLHPAPCWHVHRFESVEAYRAATADRFAEWTTEEYGNEMERLVEGTRRQEKPATMDAIEEEYELL